MKHKILSIVSYSILPYSSGGQKSIAQFNEFLGSQCDFTVISTSANDLSLVRNYTMLPWLRNGLLKFFQFSIIFKVYQLIKRKGIQCCIIEHPYMGWLGWIIRRICKIPLVVHTHNIEFLRFKSVGKKWWIILMWYERWILQSADIVFCISEEDKSYMINNLFVDSKKCHVITFGLPIPSIPIDKEEARKIVGIQHNINKEEAIILFNGVLNYEPNSNAVRNILQFINPLLLTQSNLKYKIIICGRSLPTEFNELKNIQNLIYAGLVPDIELYFKAADIFINPVLSGGGIKTKLVEALGFGTTVISAETGAIGCDVEVCGNKLVVIKDNDWDAFANAIIQNLQHPSKTPDSFYDKYYWGNITKKALDIITKPSECYPITTQTFFSN